MVVVNIGAGSVDDGVGALFNNLKKQIENKTKYNEELQQEVNKLQLELENVSRQHKETVDSYQKEIEAKNITEEKLIEKVEKMRLIADEAVILQKEIDIRCQHKIAEMVALMEKHKHQYDKMVEEKDTELELCKTKEQEQMSVKQSLETELSHVKSELLSLKEQVKIEIKEKCRDIQVTPQSAPLPTILEYMLMLKKLGLSISSLRVHLSAITTYHSKVDRLTVLAPPTPRTKRFLKGIQNSYPTLRDPTPMWDLNLVPCTLMGKPFEPPAHC
ncbi:Synaptonemal complex protein 1 [Chelonia mydas]|uniref:Synaptonemal complex protein 1 n=1 Tax=Chelonia mydas TaxID=8469 RepID=M7BNM5_CHEMY|nr:Synaptonemal complex protein 1 [Chelonia mydas]